MKAAPVIAMLCASVVTSAFASEHEVRLTWVPDYATPSFAWCLSVASGGTVTVERSDVAVSTINSELHWVPDTSAHRSRISKRKAAALFADLDKLQLSQLAAEYSAERSWFVPGETAKVIEASGEVHEVPAETTIIITHGEHYGLSYRAESSVTTTVYAPFAALDDDASHPNSREIRKIMTAWYLVLKATGPIGGVSAKCLKPYKELE